MYKNRINCFCKWGRVHAYWQPSFNWFYWFFVSYLKSIFVLHTNKFKFPASSFKHFFWQNEETLYHFDLKCYLKEQIGWPDTFVASFPIKKFVNLSFVFTGEWMTSKNIFRLSNFDKYLNFSVKNLFIKYQTDFSVKNLRVLSLNDLFLRDPHAHC